MPRTKRCTQCMEWKPITEYYKQSAAPDGHCYACKDCRRITNKIHRHKNPKMYILKRARSRAKQFGVPFNITIADFDIPERCPVFDIPLFVNKDGFEGHGGWTDNSPSLDRVIPELGYVKGNVEVVSMKANRIKNDINVGELITIARHYASKYNVEI